MPLGLHDWSNPVEFSRLREEYGDRDDFYDTCEADRPLREWFDLLAEAKWEETIDLSQSWLSSCPVDIDAHFAAAVALSEVGRQTESQEHLRWFRGLVESVLASGDGRTPETAYIVISVPEEYSVLRALRRRVRGQALIQGKIDAMTVEGERGTSTIYFNPEAHFRRLARELGEVE